MYLYYARSCTCTYCCLCLYSYLYSYPYLRPQTVTFLFNVPFVLCRLPFSGTCGTSHTKNHRYYLRRAVLAHMSDEYKDLWTLYLGQSQLLRQKLRILWRHLQQQSCQMTVWSNTSPQGNLRESASFFQAVTRNACTVVVTGQAVNLGHKNGPQVPGNVF